MEIDNLTMTRQLMIISGQLVIYRDGKKLKIQDALDSLQADQQDISSEAREAAKLAALPSQSQNIPNDRVRLGDIAQQIPTTAAQPAQANQSVVIAQRETISLEMEFFSASSTPVQGLVRHNQQQAETDRYQFLFKDGASFTIRDKWTNRSTTIWGDPHVDLSDVEGDRNGEFSDLKKSNSHTTLMLMDGTRVTFTAKDDGIIGAVDIFKGSQHLQGMGAASEQWGNGENGLFAGPVMENAASQASGLPSGDTVYASGDGNDWVDTSGHLVWGVTTGPGAVSRPTAYQSISIKYAATRESIVEVSG